MRQYVVGIDLGTTHTVVAYALLAAPVGGGPPAALTGIKLFDIEQLVAPGEVAALPLLPSVRYHAAAGELAAGALQLPWPPDDDAALAPVVMGQLARKLGAQVPGAEALGAEALGQARMRHPRAGHGDLSTNLDALAIVAAYAAARQRDVWLRTGAVDWLNRSLLSSWLPVQAARGIGLHALSLVPPLRRALMQQGLAAPHPLPALMRAAIGGN